MADEKKISFWHPASLICTCFGVGKIPFAPGTWGSLFGVAFFFHFPATISFAAIFLFFFIGVFCSNVYERKSGKHDSKEIVIDEFVGQLISYILMLLCINYKLVSYYPSDPAHLITFIISPFITFRIFDIVKRGPVGWIDRNVKGGLGVMLDDVVAGVLAGISTSLIFLLI